MDALPGGDLVRKGLEDLSKGKETVESLLVSVGASHLRDAGLAVPKSIPNPEHKLYLLLAGLHGDEAHSRYNALIQRLVSYEQALECVG